MKHGGDIYNNTIDLDFSVNTNPFGMPQSVKMALNQAVERAEKYPDIECKDLRCALAERYKVAPSQVLCGSGASEIFTAIAESERPEKALLVAPGFYGYERCLESVDCEIVYHYLKEADDFCITQNIFLDIRDDIDVMFLACPNNPTGRMIEPELFCGIMERAALHEILVVLDACFFELMDLRAREAWTRAGLDFSSLIAKYENLVIVNAYTKSMAIAGVRLGFAMAADSELIEAIAMHLPEWNVSVFAQMAGIAAAKELSYATDSVNKLYEEKLFLTHSLIDAGFIVFDSDVNYLLIKAEDRDFYQEMLDKRVLVRDCSNFEGLEEGFYRIAIRTHEENVKLLALIEAKEAAPVPKLEKIEHVLPMDIEKNSMATITYELGLMGTVLDEELAPVIKRCIHTAADFEYAKTLRFSENAMEKAKELIRQGAVIVTDTNMAYSGINKKTLAKYGGEVFCFMADEDVAAEAKAKGVTRASISMQKAAKLEKPVIFAIGNAPTALVELRKMYDEGSYRPAFIIGVPVGFVNVVASKELIMETEIPYIINEGRKGGSNVAAAICNAILYDMGER